MTRTPAGPILLALLALGCAAPQQDGGGDGAPGDGVEADAAPDALDADAARDVPDAADLPDGADDGDGTTPDDGTLDLPDGSDEASEASDAADLPPDAPPDVSPDVVDTVDVPPDAPPDVPDVVDDAADDAGSGELWIEISYRYRSASESPTTADWSYSATPWFGAAQWAPTGSSWSYIHVPDGGSLVTDPIGGTVLELGCYDRFRLFFGLEELAHVGRATVTLEGRSRATSAGVDFEVWNPGATASIVSTGSMSQDWTADIVTVDFTAEAGNGFQAVEVAPTARSCSLALRRVRLTLYDAY